MSNHLDSTRPVATLTERERTLLLKATSRYRADFRDHMMLALALGTALREHEIVALDMGDLFSVEGKARRRVSLRVFKRSSDTVKGQEVLLSDTLRAKLDKFYAWKTEVGQDTAAEAPVFRSREGKRMSLRRLRDAFHKWQAEAGFERRLGFHVLRHDAITNFYRATKDIRLTQRFARHKAIASTMIYTHHTDEDLLQAVQKLAC